MYAKALKDKTMELRKAKAPLATFLVSVSSKAKDLAKSEDPKAETFNDDHALRAINSYIKGADDNLSLLKDKPESDLYQRALAERELLKSFLPAEASEEEVRAFVVAYVEHLMLDNVDLKKSMGTIMKSLNDKFGASLNKKTASSIVMEVINS